MDIKRTKRALKPNPRYSDYETLAATRKNPKQASDNESPNPPRKFPKQTKLEQQSPPNAKVIVTKHNNSVKDSASVAKEAKTDSRSPTKETNKTDWSPKEDSENKCKTYSKRLPPQVEKDSSPKEVTIVADSTEPIGTTKNEADRLLCVTIKQEMIQEATETPPIVEESSKECLNGGASTTSSVIPKMNTGEMYQLILKNQEMYENQQASVFRRLATIEKQNKEILESLAKLQKSATVPTIEDPAPEPPQITLPIKTVNDFSEVLKKIEDSGFNNTLVSLLSKCGASSPESFVRRVIDKLFHYDFQCKITYLNNGTTTDGQINLAGTKLLSVIYAAVTKRYPTVNRIVLEVSIRNYLQLALDWSKTME